MKGKVLGFDVAAGTGAINGDDGQRYSFAAADFKSPPPAKANDAVDFEVDGKTAKNIYVTKGGGASIDLSGAASSPAVAGILAKPNIIWAAIIILGSLIGGYFNTLSLIGGGPMGMLGFGGTLLGLMFAIPVLAAVLIFFEFTNNALTPLFRLITMAAAIAGPILLPMLAGMMMGVGAGGFGGAFGGMMGGMGLVGFRIDISTIIVVGGGVLMLLTHLGIIKKLG